MMYDLRTRINPANYYAVFERLPVRIHERTGARERCGRSGTVYQPRYWNERVPALESAVQNVVGDRYPLLTEARRIEVDIFLRSDTLDTAGFEFVFCVNRYNVDGGVLFETELRPGNLYEISNNAVTPFVLHDPGMNIFGTCDVFLFSRIYDC